MTVKVFEALLAYAPVMQITMSSRDVGFVLFRDASNNEQKIVFSDRINKSSCQIDFYISHTGSPALLSQSGDGRELGFALCALNVVITPINEKEQGELDAGSAAKIWGLPRGEAMLDTVNDVPSGKVA